MGVTVSNSVCEPLCPCALCPSTGPAPPAPPPLQPEQRSRRGPNGSFPDTRAGLGVGELGPFEAPAGKQRVPRRPRSCRRRRRRARGRAGGGAGLLAAGEGGEEVGRGGKPGRRRGAGRPGALPVRCPSQGTRQPGQRTGGAVGTRSTAEASPETGRGERGRRQPRRDPLPGRESRQPPAATAAFRPGETSPLS